VGHDDSSATAHLRAGARSTLDSGFQAVSLGHTLVSHERSHGTLGTVRACERKCVVLVTFDTMVFDKCIGHTDKASFELEHLTWISLGL
jgi:hypothetical protein